MKKVLERLAWLLVPAALPACTGGITFRAVAPPPPVVTVGVGVSDQGSAPPAPPPPATAGATVDVEAEPIAQGDPEEVTATTEPPDPVYEEQTDSPNPGWVWVGGYWGWNGVDWGWNWGRWTQPPEGRVYIEPYYERVDGRVVYVRGYWGAHDAPRRSYGGDRIRFATAVRPASYHRGEHVVVEHRAGPLPGKRPGGSYEHASGVVRAVPRATAPAHRVAEVHDTATPRGREGDSTVGHETAATRDTGHVDAAHANAHVDAAHETGHVDTSHDTARETAPGNMQGRPPETKAAPVRAAPARTPPKRDTGHDKK